MGKKHFIGTTFQLNIENRDWDRGVWGVRLYYVVPVVRDFRVIRNGGRHAGARPMCLVVEATVVVVGSSRCTASSCVSSSRCATSCVVELEVVEATCLWVKCVVLCCVVRFWGVCGAEPSDIPAAATWQTSRTCGCRGR